MDTLMDPSISAAQELSSSHSGQDAAELLAEVTESQFTTAPICLVLSDDVQRTFQNGDPLIVGTSMEDIQTFFQKVISEAQVGMEQSGHRGMGGDGSRSRTARTIDPNDYSIKAERYPVPYQSMARAPKSKKKQPATADDEEDVERSEIPLDAIRLYLQEKKYFPGWSANSKRNLRKRCEDFALENGKLMYRTKKGNFVHCIEDRAERMQLLWQQHSIDHRRRDRLFHALKDKYYWKGMLSDINTMLASCEHCARVRLEKEQLDLKHKAEMANIPEKPLPLIPLPKRTSKIMLESKLFAKVEDEPSILPE
ncbi:uncharacterized protein LOC129588156 [Paramacrobiotus metropolitanus]|uniref:uncharacterized protein LOC129588156 n=1 Tax=Paramacrobiotus metropolitanus TaxID=2943436 RepID=UPI002445E779|nr:uncharacterized protein LOC129588156 [Paramacrobiotus metropolitanus]